MEAQAILTSLHFIGAELVVAVESDKEKYTTRYWKNKNNKTLEFCYSVFCKIKLKFLISVNMGALYNEVFPGYVYQLPLTCAGQIQKGKRFESTKSRL